jgi:hypothetical protein
MSESNHEVIVDRYTFYGKQHEDPGNFGMGVYSEQYGGVGCRVQAVRLTTHILPRVVTRYYDCGAVPTVPTLG